MTVDPTTGASGAFDRIAEEFIGRYRLGEQPDIQEYIDRHPDLAEDIRALFPMLIEVEHADRLVDPTSAMFRPASLQVAPHERIGDYRILRELGRGGMGVVYEAEQLSLGRQVALKVLPLASSRNITALERFRREARSAARLHHTNIVPVFDVGQVGDVAFYAMQFIAGQGLDLVVEELKRLRGATPPAGAGTNDARANPAGSPAPDRPNSCGKDATGITLTVQAAIGAPTLAVERLARVILSGRIAVTRALHCQDSTAAGSPAQPETHDPVRSAATLARGSIDSTDTPSGSALLPGGAPLSAVEAPGGRQHYFRSVAEIGRQAATALAHAHERGIVHRDVKPSNLLLDINGVVWVTDFGLATSGDNSLTATGDLLGTLRYMAPERFRGEGNHLADVYAMGVTLYELLVLRPAFDSNDRLRLIEQVRDVEPARPRALDPSIPRDLETIILKAIEKDPRRRYASADALGDDLRRFLAGEPILARQVSELEKLWKWSRRRPAITCLIVLAATLMVAGTTIATVLAKRANERADAALRAEARLRVSEGEVQNARRQAISERNASIQLSSGLAIDRGIALAEAGQADVGLHWMLQGLRTSPDGHGDFARMARQNLAGWLSQVHEPLLITDRTQPDSTGYQQLRLSPNGRSFVTRSFSGPGAGASLEIRDVFTGEIRVTLSGARFPVSFHPDGTEILTSSDSHRTVRAFDTAIGRLAWESPAQPNPIVNLAFLPGGAEFVAITRLTHDPTMDTYHDQAQVWDRAGGRPVRWFEPGIMLPNRLGRIFAIDKTLDNSNIVSIIDSMAGWRRELFRGPPGRVDHLDLSPDDRSLWISFRNSFRGAHEPAYLGQWDLMTHQPVGPVLNHTNGLENSPAGDRSITANLQGDQGTVWFRDASGLRPRGPALRGDGNVNDLQFSPDGRLAVIQSAYGTTSVYRIAADAEPVVTNSGSGQTRSLGELSRDRLASTGNGPLQLARHGRVAVRTRPGLANRSVALLTDPNDGRTIGVPARHRYVAIRSLAFDHEGRRFATGSDPGTLAGEARVWDATTGTPLLPPMPHGNYVSALAFEPGGRLLAAGDYWGVVRLWDTTTGHQVGPPLIQGAIVWSLAFSPDGKTLAVGHHTERAGRPGVRLWNVSTGQPIGNLLRAPASVETLTFRPDGRVLAACDLASLQLWDVATGQAVGERWTGEVAPVFHPDGRVLVTAGKEGTIQLRDAGTGGLLATVFTGSSPVQCLAYRDDGRLIVAGFRDGSVRLIDPAVNKPIGPPRSLTAPIADVEFQADGRRFVALDELGRTRTWAVPDEIASRDLDELTAGIEARTGFRMARGLTVVPLESRAWKDLIDRARSAPDPTRAPSEDPSWHEPMAREAEAARNHFAEAWHLDRLIAARPDDWTLYARRARVRSASDAFAGAEEDMRQVERIAGRDVVFAWQAHRVVAAVESDRTAEALWYLNRLVAARPDDWTLFEDRAAIHERLGSPRDQAADQRSALERGADAQMVLPAAEALGRTGRWSDAVQLLARCSRGNPFDFTLNQAWALAALRAGDRASYLESRAAGLAEASKPGASLDLIEVSFLLAQAPGVDGDSLKAVAQLESVRATLPTAQKEAGPLISACLGGLYLRVGLISRALACFTEGQQVVSSDINFLALETLAQARAGHLAEAQQHLDRLKSWSPESGLPFWKSQMTDWLRREAEAATLDLAFPVQPFDRE